MNGLDKLKIICASFAIWHCGQFQNSLVNAALRISGDGDGNDGNEKHNSEINPLLINLISNLFF